MRPADDTPVRILVVDDEPGLRMLVSEWLAFAGYDCAVAENVDAALARLDAESFQLVITDYNMPGRDGLELLAAIRRHDPRIAVLMMTAAQDAALAVRALTREGALDFLLKPFDRARLLDSVARALAHRAAELARERGLDELRRSLEQRSRELRDALSGMTTVSREMLRALSATLDRRSGDVAEHSARVSRYCVELAARLGFAGEELETIERAALLHDIGKVAVPDAVLLKAGPLDPAETAIMRRHVEHGYELVRQVPLMASAAGLVRGHHERYDGSGYPLGLQGDAIPLAARIFAVVDALDAMTCDRPYRKAIGWRQASAEIAAQSGRHFDPAVVDAFLAVPPQRWRELSRPHP